MSEPTLGGQAGPTTRPVPPPAAKAKGAKKGPSGNGTGGPVPPPKAKEKPEQAAAPDPKPQEPKAEDKTQVLDTVADKGAIAMTIQDIEEQLLEWWPILEQHIINTGGEKGGTIGFRVAILPDSDMGLKAEIGSSFSGSSVKRMRKAQIRKSKKTGLKQLELFSA
jgi:hypothetical protein